MVERRSFTIEDNAIIRIYGDDCETVADESENGGSITMVELQVDVATIDLSSVTEECFLETNGCISIEANHYQKAIATAQGEYKEIKDYGRYESGMKAYPQTVRFDNPADAPALIYNVYAYEDANYEVEVYAAASNPVVYQGKLALTVAANDEKGTIVNTIPETDFVPWKSNSWRKGVLDQIHIGTCKLKLHKGVNTIKLAAIDPGVVIEKLILWNENANKRDSYLGPKESKLC